MQSKPIPRLGWLVIVGATVVLVALLWLGRTPAFSKDLQEGLRTTPTHGRESGLFNTVVPDRHQRTPESNPATPEPADPDVIENEPIPELIAPKVQAILQEAGGIVDKEDDLPMEIAGTLITKA